MSFERIGNGVVRRAEKRVLGLFIDGTGLDRATRRLKKRIDLSQLVRGVTSGMQPLVARYYTLIPYEDDSRQNAFLDAVARAGLNVIVKRLPPKGVDRQVAVDVEIASDIISFALGHSRFSPLSSYQDLVEEAPQNAQSLRTQVRPGPKNAVAPEAGGKDEASAAEQRTSSALPEKRVITVVCPSRDLAYPIALAKELGIETVTADFGQFSGEDVLKSAAKWIDLSGSETIWKEG